MALARLTRCRRTAWPGPRRVLARACRCWVRRTGLQEALGGAGVGSWWSRAHLDRRANWSSAGRLAWLRMMLAPRAGLAALRRYDCCVRGFRRAGGGEEESTQREMVVAAWLVWGPGPTLARPATYMDAHAQGHRDAPTLRERDFVLRCRQPAGRRQSVQLYIAAAHSQAKRGARKAASARAGVCVVLVLVLILMSYTS